MTVPTSNARHHAGGPPAAAADPAPDDFDPFWVDDSGPIPKHLRRPAATPTAAGITPGYRHLLRADKPVTRGEYQRLRARMERAIEILVNRVIGLEAQASSREAERTEFAKTVRTLTARITDLEARQRGGRR
jgi:hypothetical protein